MPLVLDRVDAVVLAGGLNKIPLSNGQTPDYTALIPFQERASLCYTLDALQHLPQVGRICVVGPEEALRPAIGAQALRLSFVPAGETLIESIYRGLEHFSDAPLVMLISADAPLITPAAIQAFLINCQRIESDYTENLYLPVVPQRCFTGAYAPIVTGFSRFRDVTIRYGNLMLADPRLLLNPQVTRRMNALYRSRQHPITTALTIGLGVGLSYVLGVHLWHLLALDQMSRLASKRFGLGLIPVMMDYPEISIDVDEPTDYAFVAERLTNQPSATE